VKRAVEHVTALDVERALRKRYEAPAWAFLAQVRNGTGYGRNRARTAAAIAFSTWPSRGLELHGFEIKVDRQDVRRELHDPEKAEDFFRFCDRWWLVLGHDEILLPGELPPTWGLLVLSGGKIRCVTEAPRLDAKPLDRLQLAAIFRSAAESNVPAEDVQAQIEEAREKALESEREHAQLELKRLRELIADFEKASGVKLSEPYIDGKRIGKAVALVREYSHEPARTKLARLREEARATLEMLDAVAAATGQAA
jgi:hypothetical protein